MSIFSSIGHAIAAPFKGAAHLVTDPGGWAKNIGHQATDPKTLLGLAGALALPGVGGALTGALGAIPGIGGALAGGAGAIGSGLSGAEGAVGGALSHLPGAQSVASIVGGGEAAGGAIPDAAPGLPDATAGGGGIGGLVRNAGHWLTGNGGKNAIGVAQGLNGILDQRKAEQYGKDALATVEGSYAQRAPLRAQGIQQMLQSQVGNPYAGGAR